MEKASVSLPGEVLEIVRGVAELLQPVRIILYNRKVNDPGDTASFKLCVVASLEDKHEAETRVYRQLDSEIPFDILLYTPPEWEELTARPGSFAEKIARTGTVVYE